MIADKTPADEVNIGGGAKGNMVPLPLDFIPSNYDVLCGRGKKNYNSLGNQRLRRIVDSYVEQYSAATSRQDKSDILSAIVNEVRQASPHGGFIKQDPVSERWFEVGDFLAREKVSQAFRDALSFQYRSSKKFKHEKRRQRDKAAKLAKQKGQATEEDEAKTESKAPPTNRSKPLLKRQTLSVLREEPMVSSTVVVPPGQGNVQPSRPSRSMSMGHAPAPSMIPGVGAQSFQAAERHHQQSPVSQFYPFNPSAMMQHHDPSALVSRHTSWPNVFPAPNPPFNQLHPGAIGHQSMAMSHRRMSEGMMTGMSHHPAFHHPFHHSDPHPQNWTQHLQEQGPAAGMLPPSPEEAALQSSFPPGMSAHPGSAGMLGDETMMPPLTAGSDSIGARAAPRRRRPLERTSSSASATAIVAHLESSLSDLEQDENPFEPVPLPGQMGEDCEAKDDGKAEDPILPSW